MYQNTDTTDIIADLVFAYMAKDEDFPHDFEVVAIENAVKFLDVHYSGKKYSKAFFERALKEMKEKAK